MPAAARIGDPIDCGDTLAQGSGNVFINGIPATRVGPDLSSGHISTENFPPVPVAMGSSTVRINGFPAARVGDPMISHHPPLIPTIIVGSPDVVIGG